MHVTEQPKLFLVLAGYTTKQLENLNFHVSHEMNEGTPLMFIKFYVCIGCLLLCARSQKDEVVSFVVIVVIVILYFTITKSIETL